NQSKEYSGQLHALASTGRPTSKVASDDPFSELPNRRKSPRLRSLTVGEKWGSKPRLTPASYCSSPKDYGDSAGGGDSFVTVLDVCDVTAQRAIELVGFLMRDAVAGIVETQQRGARNRACENVAVRGRHEDVHSGPDDQRRNAQRSQTPARVVARNRGRLRHQ